MGSLETKRRSGKTMIAQIVLLIAGAVLGALLTAVPQATRNVRKSKSVHDAKRRRELIQSGAIDRWIMDYYDSQGEALYRCKIGDCTREIPILTTPPWLFFRPIDPGSDWLIEKRAAHRTVLPIDKKLISRQQRMGSKIWISSTDSLHFDEINTSKAPIMFIRPCPYRAIASSIATLQEETYRAARRMQYPLPHRSAKTPFRNEFFPGLPHPGTRSLRPFSVGSTTVLALLTDQSYEIAIQTRGSHVLTAPNMRAVIPNFGFESNELGGQESSFGVVYFNFLKEYLEELHNYEELIGDMAHRRLDPDWFSTLPEAQSLTQLHREGRFTLNYLGMGFDGVSGTAAVALLALVEDVKFGEELKKNIRVNWEVNAPTSSSPSVEFLDVRGSRLSYLHQQGEFQASSAFSISLALRHLEPKLAALASRRP
jgi:hypothetical protein